MSIVMITAKSDSLSDSFGAFSDKKFTKFKVVR